MTIALHDEPHQRTFDCPTQGLSARSTYADGRDRASPNEFVRWPLGSIPAAVEAVRAGARDFVTKPFDRDHLCRVVEAALEGRSSM